MKRSNNPKIETNIPYYCAKGPLLIALTAFIHIFFQWPRLDYIPVLLNREVTQTSYGSIGLQSCTSEWDTVHRLCIAPLCGWNRSGSWALRKPSKLGLLCDAKPPMLCVARTLLNHLNHSAAPLKLSFWFYDLDLIQFILFE